MSTTIHQIGAGGGNTPTTGLNASYDFQIPPDGSAIQCQGYWGLSQSIFAQNYSTTVNLIVELDQRYTYTIAPGNRESFAVPFEVATVGYSGVADVPGLVTLYSDPQPPDNSIGNVRINGSVTIGSAITIAPGQSVNIGTVATTVPISGGVSVVGNVTIGNAISIAAGQSVNIGSITSSVTITGTVQDLLVESNTTTLAGVLANTVVPLTLTNNIASPTTIAKAITGFSLIIGAGVDGFLSVWYTASGQDIYLTRMFPFYSLFSRTYQALEKVYLAPIPSGAVLKVLIEQSINASNIAVLKY